MSSPAGVTVICALASEAQSLIDHYHLKRARERPLRVFGEYPMRVVISGIGSHASAAAVGYAAGLHEAHGDDIWLNLGIAGHRYHSLGTPLLVARVSHHGRDGAWYPSLLFAPPCAVAELITHDHAVTDYPPDALCDMEAAGFMAATSRIAAGDLVQLVKVVSDNVDSGINGIERGRVHALMHGVLPTVLNLIACLREVAARLPLPSDDSCAAALLTRWHFTHTQTTQLRQLLQRHTLLAGLGAFDPAQLGEPRSSSDMLTRLRNIVDNLPLP